MENIYSNIIYYQIERLDDISAKVEVSCLVQNPKKDPSAFMEFLRAIDQQCSEKLFEEVHTPPKVEAHQD